MELLLSFATFTAQSGGCLQVRSWQSLLDPADGLHLARLCMGAPLPNVLVLAGMAVTLQEVLEAPVPGVL